MNRDGMQEGCKREAVRAHRILLIDDHPLFRAGLKAALAASGLKLLFADAAHLDAALDRLDSAAPFDLIIYDWHLPGGGGCRGLVALCELAPQAPVLVITADEDDAIRIAASNIGARDCLSKAADAAHICAAIARILDIAPATAMPSRHLAQAAPGARLTSRQRDILQMLADGDSNKLIASRLGIADATVRTHVSGILRSLAVRNRTEAVVKALGEGRLAAPPAAGIFA